MGSPVAATVARQGALGLVGGVSAGLGGLALTVVVGRLMSRADAGIYFTCIAAFTILTTVLLFGADTGLVRGLAAARAAGRPQALRPMLVTAIVPVTVAALVASLAVLLAAGPLAGVLFPAASTPSANSAVAAADVAGALRVLAPFVVAAVLATVLLNGAIRGLGSLRTYTLVQQVTLPIGRPVLVAAAVLGWARVRPAGPEHWAATVALLAWSAPLLVAAPVAAREVRRRLPPVPAASPTSPVSPAEPERATGFWRGTAPRGVAAVFEVLIVWSDVVLVTVILGAAPAAVYAAASRFVTSGTFALQAVRLSVAPLLAAAFASDDRAEASAVHRLSARLSILSTWPVYLAMSAFAPGVLTVLGHGYTEAATALTVLSLAMLGVVATGNANTVLNMAHRSHWAAVNTGAATVLMLGLDLVLIPRYGIVGAAIGWSSAMLTDAVLGVTEVRRGLHLTSFDATTTRAAAVAVLGFGAPALAVRILFSTALADRVPAGVVLAVGVLTASATYLAVLAFWRTELGLDELVAAVRRRPAPRPDSVPADTVPADTVPADTVPADTVPSSLRSPR